MALFYVCVCVSPDGAQICRRVFEVFAYFETGKFKFLDNSGSRDLEWTHMNVWLGLNCHRPQKKEVKAKNEGAPIEGPPIFLFFFASYGVNFYS